MRPFLQSRFARLPPWSRIHLGSVSRVLSKSQRVRRRVAGKWIIHVVGVAVVRNGGGRRPAVLSQMRLMGLVIMLRQIILARGKSEGPIWVRGGVVVARFGCIKN